MDLPLVEHAIRRVPGVLACQVTAGDVIVLVAPDAGAEAVSAAVRDILSAAAASPAVRVIGGRAPVVPLRRRMTGRRTLAAVSAGAAALAGAGVAAAVTGVFSPSEPARPSLGAQEAAGPPATVPRRGPADTGITSMHIDRRRTAGASSPTSRAPSEVQPDRQLATLGGASAPHVLLFPIPLPGEAAAPPRGRHPEPGPASHGDDQPSAPAAASTSSTSTTSTSSTTTTTTGPVAPIVGVTPYYDAHDNDGGERTTDWNGHDTTGPQRDSVDDVGTRHEGPSGARR